jgi:hypothetical protein
LLLLLLIHGTGVLIAKRHMRGRGDSSSLLCRKRGYMYEYKYCLLSLMMNDSLFLSFVLCLYVAAMFNVVEEGPRKSVYFLCRMSYVVWNREFGIYIDWP